MTAMAATTYDQRNLATPTRPGHWRDPLGDELEQHLRSAGFPARQDELQASLIRRHAPTSLLWLIGALPPDRLYSTVDQVLQDLDGPPVDHISREPM
jgi:hypothetical protein